jgi:colanic acid biosynthesis glycosyl transferase WcaI
VVPLLYQLEAMAYRKARLISTVSEGMRQKIIDKGVAAHKVVVVPPPADDQLFAIGSTSEGQKFRRRHGLEGKFVVSHAGNMGIKQGLNLVLDTALRLKEQQEVAFLLAGDGVMRRDLQDRAAALNLVNVWFLPPQQPAEFLQMLSATDMALIVQQASVSDIAFPSKTVTLLSAARPVGAAVTAASEIARVIRQSESGMVTQPGRADALAGTIEALFRDPEKRSTMGECGRRYALQHWGATRVLPSFESQLLKAAALSSPGQATS